LGAELAAVFTIGGIGFGYIRFSIRLNIEIATAPLVYGISSAR